MNNGAEEFPPPAYTEQEFDQKIVVADQQTLGHLERPRGEWEEHSKAAFEAVTGISLRLASRQQPKRVRNGSTSPSPQAAMGPVPIHRGGLESGLKLPLSRRFLLPEIGGGLSSSRASVLPQLHDPNTSPDLNHSWDSSETSYDVPLEDENEDLAVPPPFDVVRPDETVRMSYPPSGSTPPSPLASPTPTHRPLPPEPTRFQPEYTHPQRSHHRSLPNPPRSPNYHIEQRPSSMLASQQTPSRVDFNPSVAYNEHTGQPVQYQQHQYLNASAFYNPAISSYLTAPMTVQPLSVNQQRSRNTYYPETQPYRGSQSEGTAALWPSSMPRQSMNASHFPQRLSHPPPSQYNNSAPHRWAISEEQIRENLR